MELPRLLIRPHRSLLSLAGAGLFLAFAGTSAVAQPAACRQFEAELAQLDRTPAAAGRPARRERARLARVQANIAAMNCNRGFVLFGPPLPPQCSGLRAEAAALNGRIQQIEAPPLAAGGDPRRRRQLIAALDAYGCRRPAQPQIATAQPRSLFDVLFGRNPEPQYATPGMPLPPMEDGQVVDPTQDPNAKRSGGGNLAICVRTCDGFFFPVNYEGTRANDIQDEMCQASCPAAPTEVYWMPAGGDLERAANISGQNYSTLPNAFKYRQAYDPACTCKGRDQTWGQVLQQAESLMGSRRNDITVTPESSEQMVRAQPVRGLRGVKEKATDGSPRTERNGSQESDVSSTGSARNGSDSTGSRSSVRVIEQGRTRVQ